MLSITYSSSRLADTFRGEEEVQTNQPTVSVKQRQRRALASIGNTYSVDQRYIEPANRYMPSVEGRDIRMSTPSSVKDSGLRVRMTARTRTEQQAGKRPTSKTTTRRSPSPIQLAAQVEAHYNPQGIRCVRCEGTQVASRAQRQRQGEG